MSEAETHQREGGYQVQAGDSLSAIAKRYGIVRWEQIHDNNKQKIADPNKLTVGETLIIPSAVAPGFPDPAGGTRYADFPWIDIPTGRQATVSALFDAFWENAAVIYQVSTTASPAEYMRFGNAAHNNRNTGRQLQAGNRYYFSAWHKVGALNDPNTSTLPWAPSRVRLQVATNGFDVQVDDSTPYGSYGDKDFNDVILTVRFV